MDDTPEIIKAIIHCKDVATSTQNCECANDHTKSAEWLAELVTWRQACLVTSPPMFDTIPTSCKNCSNHPMNGGSGICNCILGISPIT